MECATLVDCEDNRVRALVETLAVDKISSTDSERARLSRTFAIIRVDFYGHRERDFRRSSAG